MALCASLLKKTTTRHEAVIGIADVREALGLPDNADVTLVPGTDGKSDFSVRCVWSSAAEPDKAPAVPPPARGKGAPVAVAKPAAAGATNDEDLP